MFQLLGAYCKVGLLRTFIFRVLGECQALRFQNFASLGFREGAPALSKKGNLKLQPPDRSRRRMQLELKGLKHRLSPTPYIPSSLNPTFKRLSRFGPSGFSRSSLRNLGLGVFFLWGLQVFPVGTRLLLSPYRILCRIFQGSECLNPETLTPNPKP